MVSSMRRVEVGSRAEHGSSISSTLGCTASARAMQSRCCWPPDSAPPGASSRSRTSRHRPARSSDCSTSVVLVVGILMRASLSPDEHVVADAHGRERVGLLEHHADAHAHLLGPDARPVDVLAVEQDLAGQRGAGHQLVHAVEEAQERRLAAARRTDERGDLAGRHEQVDALEHEVVAEPGAGVAGLERRRPGRRAADQLDGRSTGQRVGIDDLGRRRRTTGERASAASCSGGRAWRAVGAVVGRCRSRRGPSWRATIGAPAGQASGRERRPGAAPASRSPRGDHARRNGRWRTG